MLFNSWEISAMINRWQENIPRPPLMSAAYNKVRLVTLSPFAILKIKE
jgi:hypothetical protein